LSAFEKLKGLDEQRAEALKEAKSEALQKAQAAIGELSQLGFEYKLVENSGPSAATPPRKDRPKPDEPTMQTDAAKIESPFSGFDQSLPGS
jgi:hypothetical protein